MDGIAGDDGGVRLTVTVVDPVTDQCADMLVDCSRGTTVGELAAGLSAAFGRATEQPPVLYVGTEPMRPGLTVMASSVLEGSVIGLGAAAARPGSGPYDVAGARLQRSEDGCRLDVNRAPRLPPEPTRCTFRLPAAPRQPQRRPVPVLMAALPVVLAGAMVVLFHRWYFAVMGLFAPLTLLGGHLYDRRTGRRSYRSLVDEHRRQRAAVEDDVAEAVRRELARRLLEAPDPAEVAHIAGDTGPRLWERRRHDADMLVLRMGVGDVASDVVVEDPELPEHRRQQRRTLAAAPVTLPLRALGVLGVTGTRDFVHGLARWAVGQCAVLHSPADLRICLLTHDDALSSWQWFRWLPHARLVEEPHQVLAAAGQTVADRVGALLGVVAARTGSGGRPGTSREGDHPDLLVVVDGARRLRSVPGFVSLLRDGPDAGVFFVCLDGDRRLLPAECRAVVAQEGDVATVQSAGDECRDGVAADLVPLGWAEAVARRLAPLQDAGAQLAGAGLPPDVRLLDLLDLGGGAAESIEQRWAAADGLRPALIGMGSEGPTGFDLRRDGPHVLIGGTTGSGKSELLQALVVSLSVANPPDTVSFLLVDYKGGAAFAECSRLPHVVGTVTDLDPPLVARALRSLHAELRRREALLARVGAADLDDFTRLTGGRPGADPLPRLVIVVDEFAALSRELPDFVAGLVGVAARGRSLGLHLVLATQRPSGVVSSEIRANTNLRIALRVTDVAESSDILDAPDAARISKSTPGRAWARVGHADLTPFQSGRLRCPSRPAARRGPPRLTSLRPPTLGSPLPDPPEPQAADDGRTDLDLIVDAVRNAAGRSGARLPRPPWLPPLPQRLPLGSLPAGQAPAWPRTGALPGIPFALDDLPDSQTQQVALLRLDRFSHLYVVGAPRSGRSQVLRTLAGSLARTCGPADVHLYGLDCGNGGLAALATLPHCGAVVARGEADRATRLLQRLGREVASRHDIFADGGFTDIGEQRAGSAAGHRLPHVVLLLDRWEVFASSLGDVDGGALTDHVHQLLREGTAVGVHLVITGDRSLLSGRMSIFTEHKLVLRLADRADLALAGVDPRAVPLELPDGRGFWATSGIETQVALLGDQASAADQARVLTRIGDEAASLARASDADRPFRIDPLPGRLTYAEACALAADEAAGDRQPLWCLVGVGGDELTTTGVGLTAAAPAFVVAGPPRTGRSTALLTMVRSVLDRAGSVVVVAPAPSPLRDLAGECGVVAVRRGSERAGQLTEDLAGRGGPCLVVVDDAGLLRELPVADELRRLLAPAGTGGVDRPLGMVVAGGADELASGLCRWLAEVRRSRQGLLLAPCGSVGGELIGVRLPQSLAGAAVPAGWRRGRAILHSGDGQPRLVQVPVAPARRASSSPGPVIRTT